MINKRTRDKWRQEAAEELLQRFPDVGEDGLVFSVFGNDMYVNICQHFTLTEDVTSRDGKLVMAAGSDGYGIGFAIVNKELEADPAAVRRMRKRQNEEAAALEREQAAAE